MCGYWSLFLKLQSELRKQIQDESIYIKKHVWVTVGEEREKQVCYWKKQDFSLFLQVLTSVFVLPSLDLAGLSLLN